MRRGLGLAVTGAVVATGLVPLAVAAQADSERADRATTKIAVGTEPVAAEVPSQIVGGNHRWPKSGLGMWSQDANGGAGGLAAGFEALSEDTGLGTVRYPGGTVAGYFDWKNAIGPQAERGCQVGGGFVGDRGSTLDSIYGPDENQRYVEAIGAQTTMMLNSTTQSVREAENFVEYMVAEVGENPNGGKDWAKVREANKVEGQPAGPYDIDVWEIGNEPWLQHYWRSADLDKGLKQYAGVSGYRTQRQHNQPVGTECDKLRDGGRSNGKAGQEFQVWYPPVARDTEVTLKVGSSDDTWRPTRDLDSVGRDAKRFELDRKSGTVRFGNGRHGKIPVQGAQIKATYDSGRHPGFIQFYKGLNALDEKMAADISVCSSWETPEFVELMAAQGKQYDCVSPHLYVHPDMGGTFDAIHDESVSEVKNTIAELRALEKAFDEALADGKLDKRPFLTVGEYGKIAEKGTEPDDDTKDYGASISQTVMVASMLIGMIDHGVEVAEISNLNGQKGVGELFGGKPYLSTSRARMLSLASELAGSTPVKKTTTDNPEVDGGYHALRVVTTKSADTLRMFVVNRAREVDVPTEVSLPDIVAASGEATVRTLNGDKLDSFNSHSSPDDVKISEAAKSWTDRGFEHRFPAHSVTLIEIPSE